MEEAVFYTSEGGSIFIKATGHVTAAACPPLKDAVFARLEAEPKVDRICIDLEDCEYMDSTFLGLIVGTQKRFARLSSEGKRKVSLLRVNEACVGLLRTIGVLGMVELIEAAPDFPAELPRLSGESRTSARFLLDAHEELSGISDENKKRFSGLTSVLKSVLENEESKDKQ